MRSDPHPARGWVRVLMATLDIVAFPADTAKWTLDALTHIILITAPGT